MDVWAGLSLLCVCVGWSELTVWAGLSLLCGCVGWSELNVWVCGLV